MTETASRPHPWDGEYGPTATTFTPLDQTSLAQLVKDVAAARGDAPAFTVCLPDGSSATLSYAETDRLSDAFALYLRRVLGIGAGDRVAVQLPNCVTYPVAAFGVLKAGAVLVNFNPLYTASETRRQLADCGARALVVLDRAVTMARAARDGTQVEHLILADIGIAAAEAGPGEVTLRDALAQGEALGDAAPADWPFPDADDLALLQYTGGTTGISKGAELTHRNLLANLAQARALAATALKPEGEVAITALPLYHITAFTALMLLVWLGGGHNVLIPMPRPLANLRPAFERFPVTLFAAVNVMLHGLLREDWFRANPPRNLVWTISGSTALHPQVAEDWHALVGSAVYEGYGLSETSPVLCLNPPFAPPRLGTVGIPVVGTDIRIVGDDGTEVPLGQPGELQARGPQVMRGYWNRPDETAAVLKDEWFATGDVAIMDQRGFVSIVDRKKDMIDVNGFNVYPNEVEIVLNRHPMVRECAVVAAPNPTGGQEVRAYVVLTDPGVGPDDLRAWCQADLTGYKVPKSFVVMDDLPKSPVGKILRKDLRALAAAG